MKQTEWEKIGRNVDYWGTKTGIREAHYIHKKNKNFVRQQRAQLRGRHGTIHPPKNYRAQGIILKSISPPPPTTHTPKHHTNRYQRFSPDPQYLAEKNTINERHLPRQPTYKIHKKTQQQQVAKILKSHISPLICLQLHTR